MDAPTSAAVIAGLTVVGKPAVDLVKDFLGKVLAPTGDALGQAMAHPIVEWQKKRVERANQVVLSAADKVHEAGQEPQAVPSRLLIPILEKASLEEDSDLADRWANLLANASTSPGTILPAFVSILGELSPVEAKLLNHLLRIESAIWYLENDETIEGTAEEKAAKRQNLEEQRDNITLFTRLGLDVSDFDTIVDNLTRLRLVDREVRDTENFLETVTLTIFGIKFIQACSAKSGQVAATPATQS